MHLGQSPDRIQVANTDSDPDLDWSRVHGAFSAVTERLVIYSIIYHTCLCLFILFTVIEPGK